MFGLNLEIEKEAPKSTTRITHGMWSGMSVDQAKVEYSELYAVGTLSTIHFGVKLKPFDLTGALARTKINLRNPYELANEYADDFALFSREQGWDTPSNGDLFHSLIKILCCLGCVRVLIFQFWMLKQTVFK